MTTRININGTTIMSSGRGNVVVSNDRIVVDGKDVTPDAKQITIEVQGDLQSIEADACDRIHVTGSVGHVKTTSGDVRCGDVTGSVQCMSGDVSCGRVGGSVSTMSGDIRRG
jgi:hypothetical protein